MRLPKMWFMGLGITTAALLFGCGAPPAMVNMAPPGRDSEIVTDAINSEEFRAAAIGEEAISRSRVEGNREVSGDSAESDEETDNDPEPSVSLPRGIDVPETGGSEPAESEGQDTSS